jgi:hypothetical protein
MQYAGRKAFTGVAALRSSDSFRAPLVRRTYPVHRPCTQHPLYMLEGLSSQLCGYHPYLKRLCLCVTRDSMKHEPALQPQLRMRISFM